MLDFAVNVRPGGPPAWLTDRLAARLPDLGSYPSEADQRRAVAAVAARHVRHQDEVALLAGGAEGFALLPGLRPRLAALVAPSFTEPEAVLQAAGVPFQHVVLPPPFTLAATVVPDEADLVVIGNPTNPTGVLHRREEILALRRPGRLLVVDEAFADGIPGEAETLAGDSLPDVVVLRSLTKTWALAGLRVGYALGAPDVLARLTAPRPHWPLGTLQLEAIAAASAPDAVAEADATARRLAELRSAMVAGLGGLGLDVAAGAAPFVLVTVPDAELMRKHLESKGIAVRRCDTFVGLPDNYLRVAVRPEWPALVDAMTEVLQ
ncbi:Rv2231c family pyridoxal phosphate-dependent protein CobC [Mycolicibacterium houstonense]|uniref:Rv2231c family pyridoxal phosphate-dependent protein CobC n=1 Tax=Mycolicibacterium houstonense TaxID=146021 RepID=UPI003F949D62